jgi:Nif-specific regulatory protein
VLMERRPVRGETMARPATDPLIGRSRAFRTTVDRAEMVAPLDVVVLLSGETGTGKTEIARYIHARSDRASGPFLELNCASLPDSLIENELFGAVAGAHSTARSGSIGKIAAAAHGTLFLDEIGELSLVAQAKLLQFLDSGEYFPLGSPRARCAETRVLAASNVDLHAAAADGRFRSDLLYRLEGFPLPVPSLAERIEDIPELARHFCEMAARRHKFRAIALGESALEALCSRLWPGNIRQLRHCLGAAVIRAAAAGAPFVTREHLAFVEEAPPVHKHDAGRDFHGATRSFQAEFLRDALEDVGWNVSECARRVGLARSHAYTLIREFGLHRGGGSASAALLSS